MLYFTLAYNIYNILYNIVYTMLNNMLFNSLYNTKSSYMPEMDGIYLQVTS